MARPSRYHPLLVTLHWLLAVLIIAALALGALAMAPMPNTDPMKIDALRHHMVGGGLIVTLMLVRLAVRTRTSRPALAHTGSLLLDRLAWVSHRLFYVVVLGMAATGLGLALQSGALAILCRDDGSLPADFWIYSLRAVHYAVSRLLMG
jgi:cytochrome b561